MENSEVVMVKDALNEVINRSFLLNTERLFQVEIFMANILPR